MVRRYRRRTTRRPLKTVKYSNETVNCGNEMVGSQNASNKGVLAMVPPVSTQGMRKCKNFTLHIETNLPYPIVFALVFVPQGQTPQEINIGNYDPQSGTLGTVSLYEPNQNVILSGVVRSNSPQLTFRTRLARNLNSGDGIALVYKQVTPVGTALEFVPVIYATLNYAITY